MFLLLAANRQFPWLRASCHEPVDTRQGATFNAAAAAAAAAAKPFAC